MTIALPQISGITSDSRLVEKNFMFVAVTGNKHDGADFIKQAIEKGASVIAAHDRVLKEIPKAIKSIETDNPRQFLALSAAEFYKEQPETIVTVTGTNGKTSTVNFVRQIWENVGLSAASIGTLGVIGNNIDGYSGMTTPDPVWLHQILKEITKNKITHTAIEASSIGIEQYRLDGVKIKAAGFTNLTRDHLDYHGTMEEYLAAKLRLFSDLLDENGIAVVNADTPEFESIQSRCRIRKIPCWGYGFKGKELRLLDRKPTSDGQKLYLEIFGKKYDVTVPLVGEFQAMNILCSLGLVLSEVNSNQDQVILALEKMKPIPGRLQLVEGSTQETAVYVDYAHTPDALENILSSLRPHTTGRLICLFGCGGDRDAGKRPVMGEISTRLADITIVTDDNPRSEDPSFIRKQILDGCASDAIEIDGRRSAIKKSVSMLRPGDVLVLAGKGHEQGQIFSTHTEPFDDVFEAKAALKEAASSF